VMGHEPGFQEKTGRPVRKKWGRWGGGTPPPPHGDVVGYYRVRVLSQSGTAKAEGVKPSRASGYSWNGIWIKYQTL